MRIKIGSFMPTNTKALGNIGEKAAENYLKLLGYRILDTNYLMAGVVAIDIIAVDRDKSLLLVEVKTMHNVSRETFNAPSIDAEPTAGHKSVGRSADTLLPEDQLTKSKLEKMKRAAQLFQVLHNTLVKSAGFRIDAIAVDIFD